MKRTSSVLLLLLVGFSALPPSGFPCSLAVESAARYARWTSHSFFRLLPDTERFYTGLAARTAKGIYFGIGGYVMNRHTTIFKEIERRHGEILEVIWAGEVHAKRVGEEEPQIQRVNPCSGFRPGTDSKYFINLLRAYRNRMVAWDAVGLPYDENRKHFDERMNYGNYGLRHEAGNAFMGIQNIVIKALQLRYEPDEAIKEFTARKRESYGKHIMALRDFYTLGIEDGITDPAFALLRSRLQNILNGSASILDYGVIRETLRSTLPYFKDENQEQKDLIHIIPIEADYQYN